MKILVTVSYKGTAYYGWQKQPDKITIQEVIENNLSQFFDTPITIYGAGRTDAGVHALGQTFHFIINKESVDLDRFIYSLNMMLPKDIKFIDAVVVDNDFHARYNACGKEYEYKILLMGKDPFKEDYYHLFPHQFDIEIFKECLSYFVGKHNFKNFTSKPEDEDNFVRHIFSIDINQKYDEIRVVFKGDGFMQYMIRDIVGTALACSSNKITLERVKQLLDPSSKREIVSYKAPSKGLYLNKVIYNF